MHPVNQETIKKKLFVEFSIFYFSQNMPIINLIIAPSGNAEYCQYLHITSFHLILSTNNECIDNRHIEDRF